MRLGLVALALLLAGCAYGVADLQREEVKRRAFVSGDHAQIARCAVQAFEEAPSGGIVVSPGDYRWIVRERPRTVEAIGKLVRPLLAFTFSQQQGGAVVIESRRRWGLAAAQAEESAWPLIERCAGQKVAVEPPIR